MNKKRAKFNFILTTILLVGAIFLCFAQFNLPSSNFYNGMFNSISATSEITYGNNAVYKITSNNTEDENIESAVVTIRDILNAQGFVGSKVYRQGEFIKAEVESKSNASSILSIIGDSKSFFISSKSQEEITESELNSYDIVGTDVKNAYSSTIFQGLDEYNSVTIQFTKQGAKKYAELTKQVSATDSSKVYFYIDGKKSTELEVEATTNDFLSFYSKGNNYSAETAQEYALQILMSSTGVQLKTVSNNTSTATLGSNVLMLCMLATALLLLSALVLFPVFFGELGLVADLSVLLGGVFNILLLQALPFTTGSIATIFGSLIGMGILVITHVVYLNKIKSEFSYLHKLQLAARTGFKKSWLINLDICTMVFLGAVSLTFWNIPYVSTFAIGLAVASFVALFNVVVIFKDFVTWYVTINNKNFKKVKFTKGENHENKI